jgi:hypothetical protein
VTFFELPGGEDWILSPVHAGLLAAHSLLDGSVDLCFLALLSDSLAVRADNEELLRPKD